MKEYIDQAMTYREYLLLIEDLVSKGRTTGSDPSEAKVKFTDLNRIRMRRLDTTLELFPETVMIARANPVRMYWLVITEAWCGDAAQNIPAIEKIADESGNIETRYILRDDHPDLMDRFLSEGARSIPKLVAIDAATYDVIATWGPRPQPAKELYQDLNSRGVEKPAIMEQLQRWYNSDKGKSVQREFVEMLTTIESENILDVRAMRVVSSHRSEVTRI